MRKNGIIVALIVCVLGLAGYAALQNQEIGQLKNSVNLKSQVAVTAPLSNDDSMNFADGGPISHYPDEYVLIPELRIGFSKIQGLTMNYQIKNGGAVAFSSEELTAAAQKSPALAYCATDGFSSVRVSNIPRDQAEFQGYAQKKLADGRYLNTYGPGAVCYTDAATQKDKDFANSQFTLFYQFINSGQSY